MNDLISRKAAILKMEVNTASAASLRATDPVYIAFLNGFKELFKKELDECKPADVVPVVRGEWVLQGKNEHHYETSVEEKCSLCGRYVYRYDTQPQDNYCPNCGADMRKAR